MIREFRAFLEKKPFPLELESYKAEHELEPYWMGRPAKGPYALHMAAALACGLVAAFLYLSGSVPSLAVLLAGLLVASLYPFVSARDWHQTEYLLTPDVVVQKAGAFSKGLRVHELSHFTAVEEETPRFANRLGYRNLHLRAYAEASEGQAAEVAEEVKIPNLPAAVAAGFLDVLDMLAAFTPAAENVMTEPSAPTESEPPGDQP